MRTTNRQCPRDSIPQAGYPLGDHVHSSQTQLVHCNDPGVKCLSQGHKSWDILDLGEEPSREHVQKRCLSYKQQKTGLNFNGKYREQTMDVPQAPSPQTETFILQTAQHNFFLGVQRTHRLLSFVSKVNRKSTWPIVGY
jgi:hypothetical protein